MGDLEPPSSGQFDGHFAYNMWRVLIEGMAPGGIQQNRKLGDPPLSPVASKLIVSSHANSGRKVLLGLFAGNLQGVRAIKMRDRLRVPG